jgi:hypothetical protein
MFWKNIKRYEKAEFKRLTGVELGTFKVMAKEVRKHDKKIVSQKGNNRSRPFHLSTEDQLLMMLMYYREYRTQFHIGETYSLHESNVGKGIRRVENILKRCKRFQLPGKQKLSGTSHTYEVVLIDATESPIERPKKNNTSTTRAKRRSTPSKHKSLSIKKQRP